MTPPPTASRKKRNREARVRSEACATWECAHPGQPLPAAMEKRPLGAPRLAVASPREAESRGLARNRAIKSRARRRAERLPGPETPIAAASAPGAASLPGAAASAHGTASAHGAMSAPGATAAPGAASAHGAADAAPMDSFVDWPAVWRHGATPSAADEQTFGRLRPLMTSLEYSSRAVCGSAVKPESRRELTSDGPRVNCAAVVYLWHFLFDGHADDVRVYVGRVARSGSVADNFHYRCAAHVTSQDGTLLHCKVQAAPPGALTCAVISARPSVSSVADEESGVAFVVEIFLP